METDLNYEDSIMEDATINAETPQPSLAASDSQCPSQESTRASTPTENGAEDVSANNFAFKSLKNHNAADDVTMKDLDLKEREPTGAQDDLSSTKIVSWPSSAVIDPGSSPGKVGKIKEEFVDYAADQQDTDELLQRDDLYSLDLRRP